MAIKHGNVTAWKQVDNERLLVLKPARPNHGRVIRLEVNPLVPVRVDLMREGERLYPLARCERMEVIEFSWKGDARISFSSVSGDLPQGEPVAFVYTPEFDQYSVQIPDAETFTKIAMRRARNPELEWMQFMMMQNIDARMEQMEAELVRRYGADPNTGEIPDDPENDGVGAGGDATGATGDISQSGSADPEPETVADAGSQTAKAAKAAGSGPDASPARSA